MFNSNSNHRQGESTPRFYISTCDTVPGAAVVEYRGFVAGSSVRARSALVGALARLKACLGGRVDMYAYLLEQVRHEALDRMKAAAERLGANGVIAVRFTSASAISHTAELHVYGTAVVVSPAVRAETPAPARVVQVEHPAAIVAH